MYAPTHFREDRIDVLHDAIRRIRLATLVTVGADGPLASHIPMLLDPEPAPLGTLCGHVARANPQWRDCTQAPALAIFLGPEAYVSPSWYPTKRQTGKVVPTWNYVAVHARGALRTFDDPDRLLAFVTRLTATHETGRPRPWQVGDAPESFIRGLLGAIVGLEMPIARLEGSWKMSQNRPEEDSRGVVEALSGSPRAADRTVADVMALLANRKDL